MNLRTTIKNVNSLFGCHYMIAIKVGCPLFEFSEIFNRFKSSLRTEEPLNTYSPQSRSFYPMPEFLWSNIANQMVCPVCVSIGMTIKTGNTKAGPVSSPVFGSIKLLLWKLGDQQAQSFKLFWI